MSRYAGIRGRRVLITGASSGLGFAMAKSLLSQGARVFVTGRDQGRVAQALVELRSPAGECAGALMDVRDEHSIRAIVGVPEILRLQTARGIAVVVVVRAADVGAIPCGVVLV